MAFEVFAEWAAKSEIKVVGVGVGGEFPVARGGGGDEAEVAKAGESFVFGLLAGLFFVLLYNPGILLECVLLAVSFGLFASYYLGFEKKYD